MFPVTFGVCKIVETTRSFDFFGENFGGGYCNVEEMT